MQIEDRAKKSSAAQCPVTDMGREFNPFAETYLGDPYAFWARARQTEPVFYSAELDYWVVTRYEDIKAIFADPKTFSASNAQTPIEPLAPEVVRMLQSGGLKTKAVMSNADPPHHTRVRKFAWQAFTPKRVAELEPDIRRIVNRFIDRIEGEKKTDLVRGMFYDLPVHVLFIFLGLPPEDVAKVKAWSHKRLMLTWGKLTPEQQMTEARGLLEYWQYTEAYVESLLSAPPDNYVGDLIRVHQMGGVSIPEGADLLLALCSGNRDGAHFAHPDELDFDRENAKTHLSFGFGIHYCLGAPLARQELKIILEELSRRKPAMQVASGQAWEYSPNTSFRGPAQLWVDW